MKPQTAETVVSDRDRGNGPFQTPFSDRNATNATEDQGISRSIKVRSWERRWRAVDRILEDRSEDQSARTETQDNPRRATRATSMTRPLPKIRVTSHGSDCEREPRQPIYRNGIRARFPKTVTDSSSRLSNWLAGLAGIPEILSTDGDCHGWGRR